LKTLRDDYQAIFNTSEKDKNDVSDKSKREVVYSRNDNVEKREVLIDDKQEDKKLSRII
jgi:hypothetical protein